MLQPAGRTYTEELEQLVSSACCLHLFGKPETQKPLNAFCKATDACAPWRDYFSSITGPAQMCYQICHQPQTAAVYMCFLIRNSTWTSAMDEHGNRSELSGTNPLLCRAASGSRSSRPPAAAATAATRAIAAAQGGPRSRADTSASDAAADPGAAAAAAAAAAAEAEAAAARCCLPAQCAGAAMYRGRPACWRAAAAGGRRRTAPTGHPASASATSAAVSLPLRDGAPAAAPHQQPSRYARAAFTTAAAAATRPAAPAAAGAPSACTAMRCPLRAGAPTTAVVPAADSLAVAVASTMPLPAATSTAGSGPAAAAAATACSAAP